MALPEGQLVLVSVFLLAHLLLAYNLYRHWERDRPVTGAGQSADGEATDAGDDGTVTCPDCGTGNQRGYRYCRICISELPTQMRFTGQSESPAGRTLL